MKTPINTIKIRLGMSLEAPFLSALLREAKTAGILDKINICGHRFAESIRWEFVDSCRHSNLKLLKSQEDLENHQLELLDQGVLCFNVGDEYGPGLIDHHGEKNLSSIDMLRNHWDFTENFPWILEVYLKVSYNDANGTKISEGENIRDLMTGVEILLDQGEIHQRTAFDVMSLAFQGVFQCCKKTSRKITLDGEDFVEVDETKVMGLKHIKAGLRKCRPEFADWFDNFIDRALQAVKDDWQKSLKALLRAESMSHTFFVNHPKLSPLIKRKLRIIFVHSNTWQIGKASRNIKEAKKRNGNIYDLIVIWKPVQKEEKGRGGNYLVFSSDINQRVNGKTVRQFRVALPVMAGDLRWAEIKCNRGRKLPLGTNLESTGLVYDEKGELIVGFLADFLTMVASACSASPNTKTQLRHDHVWQITKRSLPKCRLLCKDPDEEEWHPYKP